MRVKAWCGGLFFKPNIKMTKSFANVARKSKFILLGKMSL